MLLEVALLNLTSPPVLAFALGLLAALFSANPGLFSVVAALATAALFFFPIRYDARDVVAEKARTPLTAATSPLLLWGLLVVLFLGFCALVFGF